MPSGALQPRLASKPLLRRHAVDLIIRHDTGARLVSSFHTNQSNAQCQHQAQNRRASCATPKLAHRCRWNHPIKSLAISGVHWSRNKWATALPSKGSTKGNWCSECASRMSVANLATCLESSLQRHSFARAQPIHRARQVDHARNSNNDRHGLLQSSP